MEYIFILLAGFLLALSLAQMIIPRILIVSLRKRLFDVPDARKIHNRPVSRLGGVSFFPAILFTVTFLVALCKIVGWCLFSDASQVPEVLLLCSGLTLLFIVGIGDDLVGVRYRKKFIVQFLSACMFPLAGLYINDLYGLFWIHSIPVYIGMPFTVLLVIFITNAINLIDGIDGLASGLSMVALFVYTCLFAYNGLWIYSLIALTTVGVLLPFFYFNVFGNANRGKKIFMGDTGSLTLGFILSFLTIKYTMNEYEATNFNYEGAILVAFSLLLVPCLDVIRVVMRRVRNGKSPFLPDKTHIHHKFLAMGFTPRKAMLSILGVSLAFGISNILLISHVNNTLLFIADVVVWTVMNLWMDKVIINKSR
ncbi:MraY family glycosyltransferase [Phocaeicola sp.]